MSITKTLNGGLLRNDDPGDEGGGAAPSVETEVNPPQFDASGIYDPDGKYLPVEKDVSDSITADWWNRNIAGKDRAGVATHLKNNQDAARQKSVSYPGAESTDEDWGRWREVAGVPESPDQVMPEDFEAFQNATGWTKEVATPVIQAMIDAGAPGPAIVAAAAAVQQAASTQLEAWQAEAEEGNQAARAEVEAAFGDRTDDRIDGAVVAAEKLALKSGLSAEQIEDVKNGVQEIRNPAITRMFANLADAIQEASYRGPGAAEQATQFRSDKEEADAIMSDPGHPMHERFINGDPKVNDHVDRLLKKATEKKAG